MVTASAAQATGAQLIPAVAALAAVLGGAVWRPAATLAVLLTVGTLAVAVPAPMVTVLSGLTAALYLVLRHGPGTVTPPSMLAVTGFAAVAALVTAAPLHVPWLPLAAPLALLGAYLVAVRPFLRGG
ncbi:hypothetical protein E4P42_14840 [Mycobacterium sp. PS03-16]|nr:hypothetical protein E4P42_14840 [Mycobacterium sp. PS03-16]